MAVRLFLPKNITPKLSSQERNPALLKFCSSGKSLHPREEEHCLGNESSHISPGTSDGKAFACSVGDPGFNPWVGNIPWRREWQPNPVFLAGEFQGQRTLVDYIVSAITRVGHSWAANTHGKPSPRSWRNPWWACALVCLTPVQGSSWGSYSFGSSDVSLVE